VLVKISNADSAAVANILVALNTSITHYDSGSQNFPDRIPFVGRVLSPRTTLFQENSIFQILFNEKFGKPGLRHEKNGCEKL